MESKALVKSTNNIVACIFFARRPSRILWIVNFCEVVDRFLRKAFSEGMGLACLLVSYFFFIPYVLAY